MQKQTVLLIEDSPDYSKIIAEYIESSGEYTVTCVPTPHDAFQTFEYEKHDLFICDLHLPFTLDERFFDYPYSVEVGAKTIEELRNTFPQTPIIGITAAMENEEFVVKRMKELTPVLRKPFSRDILLELMGSLLGKRHYHENELQ